ncbi:uncharacterized protein LOC142317657 [Lycorma delicatula]|uniref:uncharacterized protein LOC142317657 n=1 Tax=Lycorma delicatula TaxID=130591 RepID=UPI003F51651F
MENIPNERLETGFTIEESSDKVIKTLGMFWQPSSDSFRFKINLTKPPTTITKRFILSDISKLFDPIGIIAPVVITAKLIMQEVWQINDLGWDEIVPEQIQVKWTNYRNSLQILNHLSVGRRVASGYTNQRYEMHGFSDASERAYGACFYLRTIQEDIITVKRLCSKSRVAPLKSISLPRLELCGALLLAKLI